MLEKQSLKMSRSLSKHVAVYFYNRLIIITLFFCSLCETLYSSIEIFYTTFAGSFMIKRHRKVCTPDSRRDEGMV